MNKRERVLAAVAGDKPDRVPGGFGFIFRQALKPVKKQSSATWNFLIRVVRICAR